MVLLQAYEHRLRSYRPFQCWLLMTVIEKKTAQPEVKSYLIDSIRFKDSIKDTIGAICRDTSILKLVEA